MTTRNNKASQPQPPEDSKIIAAISAVMNEVPRLDKIEKNRHAGYNFASVDDFLQAMRPLCSKNGLVILQEELETSTVSTLDRSGKEVAWIQIRWEFRVCHVGGESIGPLHRTSMVMANMGAQAYGAAQSYALKQFLRSLFQVATGDKEDADHHPQADLPKQSRFGTRENYLDTSLELKALQQAADVIGTQAVQKIMQESGAPPSNRVTEQSKDAFLAGMRQVMSAVDAHGNKEPVESEVKA